MSNAAAYLKAVVVIINLYAVMVSLLLIIEVFFLNPTHALQGGVSYFAFVCLSVCVCVRYQNISKNIEPINFIFGGSLPCDPGRKPFDFEKNPPGVRVCGGVGGGGIWP